MAPTEFVDEMLQRARVGDAQAAGELFTRVYTDLRAVAQARMNGERADHTLQATALVHEAFMRLMGDASVLEGDERFFGAAAEALKNGAKGGGGSSDGSVPGGAGRLFFLRRNGSKRPMGDPRGRGAGWGSDDTASAAIVADGSS
ncbi:MAG: hypothetical protein K2Q09_01855 [Phycisphaerales bacterium]|nr:hypothetical protein [Phycisphaerales bacterium]